jgi:hypothetical protein
MKYPQEQIDYFIKRIKKDKVHPEDVFEEMKKLFKEEFKRTYPAFRQKLKELKIPCGHLTPKRLKTGRLTQTAEKRIQADTEKFRLQQKHREVTTKYRVLVQEKTLGDRLIQVLYDEVKALPEVKRAWHPSTEKVSQETAILLLSDSHIGEVVRKEEVYNFGEYDFDIFVKRLKFLANSIKSITTTKLKGYRIDKLVIYCLGDMVSGRIHEELMEKGEEIIFQVLQGSFVTAQFVLELSQMFSEIEIVGVVGNHGRLTKKPPYKRKYVNWDYVFYQFLSMFLAANDRIKCNFPKSFFTVHKIYDWSFLLLHGDNIQSWQLIPFYGIERMMYKLGDLLQGKGQNIDYRVLGHFHNSGELDRGRGEILINGSVIGGTEYSLGRLFAFDRPTQLFMGCHREIGVVWRYPLRLDLKGVKEVTPYKYNQELNAAKYMKELLKGK